MIVLNLKTYDEAYRRLDLLVDAAREAMQNTGVRIIICPPPTHLARARYANKEVFAQHVDPFEPGAHTGSVLPEALQNLRIKGSLINHSERRCPDLVKETVKRMKKTRLESLVCAESPEECKKFAKLKPSFIAVEPPELIGSGKSVSKNQPDVITESLNKVHEVSTEIPLLVGAGVSNAEDVEVALALGATGVLLASAFVKAPEPVRFLEDIAKPFEMYGYMPRWKEKKLEQEAMEAATEKRKAKDRKKAAKKATTKASKKNPVKKKPVKKSAPKKAKKPAKKAKKPTGKKKK
ncbi:triose-phosphate isomerase [Candidatus Micrarchaeota archaeon]|nr:triose-phosphate isomerase [Candidatus Micrarchaeota archaeon]MBD3417904.1 triose-phosphate isomerase [Candidatus Micrarchaeota archaeon]